MPISPHWIPWTSFPHRVPTRFDLDLQCFLSNMTTQKKGEKAITKQKASGVPRMASAEGVRHASPIKRPHIVKATTAPPPSLPHHITSHQSLMQQRGSRTMTSRRHHTMCLCPSWDSIGRGGSGRGQLRYMVTPHQQHITVTHTTGRRPVSTRMRNPLQWSTLPKYSGQKGIA